VTDKPTPTPAAQRFQDLVQLHRAALPRERIRAQEWRQIREDASLQQVLEQAKREIEAGAAFEPVALASFCALAKEAADRAAGRRKIGELRRGQKWRGLGR
jgi:hypothetical protein